MKTILLVEDDIVLRETTAEILELENYKVVTAANGRQGVSIAKKVLPDIIVCDIMMPELDGYDVFKLLSVDDKTKRIPFIFLSAKTEMKDIRTGMDLGADDYLTKPIDDELLLSAIESRLAKAELLKEAEQSPKNSKEENQYPEIETIEELKNYFCDFGKVLKCKKGELIYEEGKHCNNVYLVYKGKVKGYKIDEYGKELIVSIYKDDEFFGFSAIFDQTLNYESVMAMEKVEVMAVDKKTVQEILKNNYNLSLEIFQLVNENLTEIKEQLLQMAYGSMRKKTAATILKFAKKMGYSATNSINISRRDLASVAGIATESLIRTLTDLKKEGLIDIEGRNIQILDLQKLENIN